MNASLKAFMKGIIDYAGLFPPADLSLDTAIQNYGNYRKCEDAWMLSRFIIPALELKDLSSYGKLFKKNAPFDFSVLGKGTETVSEFQDHLKNIVEAVEQFHEEHAGNVTTDILEIKLSREAVFANDADLLLQIYKDTADIFDRSGLTPNHIFFEAFFEENWKKEVALVLEVMNEHNKNYAGKNIQKLGYKLRCGGVKAHFFPSVEQVAFAINKARDHNLAMKCTAGLHHPIRHYADPVQTMMHGFFNVFGGAILSHAHDLTEEELVEILNEEDPEHFIFLDDEFGWQNLSVSTDKIAELRESALISFGSCSFDEPRDDLKDLGLL